MFISLWNHFTDPVLQASVIGSMLMCFASGLIGVIVFLRKRSLLGESLSHAAYPGVVCSALLMASFFPKANEISALVILIGATITSSLGLLVIDWIEAKGKVKNDAALCFVLSLFFGMGVLFASRLQFASPLWYRSAQVFLYGQAATMTLTHVIIYAGLAFLAVILVASLYRPIQMSLFDREFSDSVGVKVKLLDFLLFVLVILAIIVGIRSVGVVLMAGMLIAPAVAARQWTSHLSHMFIVAGVVGACSGFLGNYFSVELPRWGLRHGWNWNFSLPTGPMVLLSASLFASLSLLLSPRNGWLTRRARIASFRRQCLRENLLKFLWKQEGERGIEFCKLEPSQKKLISKLCKEGWIDVDRNRTISLTREGRLRAARIVRLHRLWEAYLVFLGQGAEKVHRNAEEMEHIITPELEKELVELLGDPTQDPHHQPIPPKWGEG